MLCPSPLPSGYFSNPHTADLLKKVQKKGKEIGGKSQPEEVAGVYRICPYRSRARIEARLEQEFTVNRSRTGIDTPLDRHVCVLSWLVTYLEDELFSWIVELRSRSIRVSRKMILQQTRSLSSAKDFHASTG